MVARRDHGMHCQDPALIHSTWLYALGSVFVVSLVSLIGLTLISLNEERVQQVVFLTVSLAVGAMFGDVFIHLLPQVFADPSKVSNSALFSLCGLLLFFLLEKFLLWRHEHVPHYGDCIQPVGYVSLVADGLHNFIDGILIGTSYLVSIPVGVATTVAVLLHEIPQEIGDFGVLLHAGFNRSQALWLNLGAASCAIAGTATALVVGSRLADFPAVMLPLTAGGFIYIAGSDLVPELHKERDLVKSLMQLFGIGAGVGLMLLLKVLEG